MPPRKKELTFEEKMKQLEQIVSELENGQAPLDKSMEMFEQGMKLSLELKKELENAEQKITMLTQKNDGSIEQTDFEQEEV